MAEIKNSKYPGSVAMLDLFPADIIGLISEYILTPDPFKAGQIIARHMSELPGRPGNLLKNVWAGGILYLGVVIPGNWAHYWYKKIPCRSVELLAIIRDREITRPPISNFDKPEPGYVYPDGYKVPEDFYFDHFDRLAESLRRPEILTRI